MGVADAADVHAEQFQLGAHVGAGEGGLPAAQAGRHHLGHLVARRHETKNAPAPQRALADGVDVGIGRAALVVDDDAAAFADLEPAGARQLVARPDAGREDDEIGFQMPAVGELHAVAAGFAVHDLARIAPGVHAHAERLDLAPQQRAAAGVELHRHQLRRELDHVRLEAERLQRIGRFETQQATAHHHADTRALRRLPDGVEVVQRAVHEAARPLAARHRRHERIRAARDHQRVVGQRVAGRRGHRARRAVDARHRRGGAQLETVLGVEPRRGQRQLVRRLVAEVLRQVHAVVGGAGFLAAHGEREAVGRRFGQGVDQMLADHAVADHHHTGRLHGFVLTGKSVVARRQQRLGQRPAEGQHAAGGRDVGPVVDELPEPGAVGDVAHQHGAGEAAVVEIQTPVHAGGGIAQHQRLAVRGLDVAGRENVDAAHLELGRHPRAGVDGVALARHSARPHRGLLVQRRHQAVGDAAVFGALAERIDQRVRRGQGVVHQHAAIAGEPGLAGQLRPRADADGEHHEARRNAAAVLELDRFHVLLAAQRRAAGGEFKADAAAFEIALHDACGFGVELAVQEMTRRMQHGHVQALAGEADGGFKTQQATAHHHRRAARRALRLQLLQVGQRAKGDHARQVDAGEFGPHRARAGGDQQAVVGQCLCVAQAQRAGGAVDGRHRLAGDRLDAVFGEVVRRRQRQAFGRHVPGQRGGQEHAVVGGARLVADDADPIPLRCTREQLVHGAPRGHAVANHDQMGAFVHVVGFKRATPAPAPAGTPVSAHPRWRTQAAPSLGRFSA